MQEPWRAREVVPAAVAVVVLPLWSRGIHRFGPPTGRAIDPVGLALVMLAGAMLLLRRRRPLLTLAVVTAAVTTYLALGYAYGPVLATFLLAVYSVARHLPFRTAAPAAALAVLVMLGHLLVREPVLAAPTAVTIGSAWAVVPFAVGVAVRQRRNAADSQREVQVQVRLDSERLRLSRDVHDVVGHGLAAIHLQASVALRAADRDDPRAPQRMAEALSSIERASADSLAELRDVLQTIPADGGSPRDTTPGLAALPALIGRMSAPGAPVRLRVDGDPAPLAAAPGLALYRVAQEALANAVRHGEGGPVDVVVDHSAEVVRLTVTNTAAPGQGDRIGMGLPSMRDRLGAVGGTLITNHDRRRFELVATVPREEPA